MTLLALDHASKTYYRGGRHRVRVLRDVSLTVAPGERVAVVGDPTSGKTTLLRIAAGIEAPDHGSVRFEGRELPATADPDPRIALVARIVAPRETHAMQMLDFVALGLFDDVPRREARHRSSEALDAFGLADVARATWNELSDVERTLVRIAQAVVRRPALLLLDDPVLGLGISHAETVLAQLDAAARASGTASLVACAQTSEATRADTILTLNAGMLLPTPGARAGGRVVDLPVERRR